MVADDFAGHLAAVEGDEDLLARLELDVEDGAEAGPDQVHVPELGRSSAGVRPLRVELDRVARVRRQVDAVVVLRVRGRRLHGVDHPAVVDPVLPRSTDPRTDYGPFR